MKKNIFLSIVAVVAMVFATGMRLLVGNFNPFTELPEQVWNDGWITKLLSFQHPTMMITTNYPVSDQYGAEDPGTALFGLFLWIVTIFCIVKVNKKEWYDTRYVYFLGLILLTAIRLGYWIPYLLAH